MKNQLLRKYKITCRVCRLDAPENLVFPRYVDRHYDDAGMGKMAETLVLSGFSGGGGQNSKPRAAFHPIPHPATLRHPATRMYAFHVNCHLAGSQTKKRHKLRLTCVFVMQKKVVI